MDAPREHFRHRLILAALAGLGLLIAGEGWWWREAVVRARRARSEFEQKRRELRALTTQSPSPTPAVARQIENELARRRQMLADLEGQPGGRGPSAESLRKDAPLPERADDFFAAAAFRERMRACARASGVAVKADEPFGINDSRGATSSRPAQAAVRERLAAEGVLGVLFAAGPQELVAVERRAAGDAGVREAPEAVFRLVFVGETRALRGFLNGLAEVGLPWRVREVEVEPAGRPSVASKAPNDRAGPVVPRGSSRFVVTVELDGVPSEG